MIDYQRNNSLNCKLIYKYYLIIYLYLIWDCCKAKSQILTCTNLSVMILSITSQFSWKGIRWFNNFQIVKYTRNKNLHILPLHYKFFRVGLTFFWQIIPNYVKGDPKYFLCLRLYDLTLWLNTRLYSIVNVIIMLIFSENVYKFGNLPNDSAFLSNNQIFFLKSRYGK